MLLSRYVDRDIAHLHTATVLWLCVQAHIQDVIDTQAAARN